MKVRDSNTLYFNFPASMFFILISASRVSVMKHIYLFLYYVEWNLENVMYKFFSIVIEYVTVAFQGRIWGFGLCG